MSQAMMQSARGIIPSELVLKNAVVLNVFTKELLQQDVAICKGTIVGVGTYEGLEEVDCTGKFIVPGWIDAHLHIESSMLLPSCFVQEIAPWGTTTVIADPHEIGNVSGLDGIRFLISQSQNLPCNIYFMLPSCVPATPFDINGATLNADSLEALKGEEHVLGLGEVMNYQGVVEGDPDLLEKLQLFADKPIDGHAPLLTGKDLQAYLLAGVMTDHECSAQEEAAEKLRNGMYLLAREGSAAKNLEEIINAVFQNHLDFDRIAFCTDDRHIGSIRRQGHISRHIKKAIRLGVDPITAYLCASLHPAQIYGLKHLGAVAAGYQADLVVLDSLLETEISAVYHKGRPVKREAQPAPQIPHTLMNTVRLSKYSMDSLILPCGEGEYPVIEVIPRQINTRLLWEPLPHRDGIFTPNQTYCKVAVLERHHATPSIGLGVVKGFSLHGAAASTVAHDSHNLIVIGDNDADIFLAIKTLEQMQGGYAAVLEGQVMAAVPLPVCGLMSDQDGNLVEKQTTSFIQAVRKMGMEEQHDPFQTLSFLSLPVIPEARLTHRGIFDSLRFEYLPFAPKAAE